MESRRRTDLLLQELQSNAKYYSQANARLKNENAELERQLLVAKEKIHARTVGAGTHMMPGLHSHAPAAAAATAVIDLTTATDDVESISKRYQDSPCRNTTSQIHATESRLPCGDENRNRPTAVHAPRLPTTHEALGMRVELVHQPRVATQPGQRSEPASQSEFPHAAPRANVSTPAAFSFHANSLPRTMSLSVTRAIPSIPTIAVKETYEEDEQDYLGPVATFAMRQAQSANAATAASSLAQAQGRPGNTAFDPRTLSRTMSFPYHAQAPNAAAAAFATAVPVQTLLLRQSMPFPYNAQAATNISADTQARLGSLPCHPQALTQIVPTIPSGGGRNGNWYDFNGYPRNGGHEIERQTGFHPLYHIPGPPATFAPNNRTREGSLMTSNFATAVPSPTTPAIPGLPRKREASDEEDQDTSYVEALTEFAMQQAQAANAAAAAANAAFQAVHSHKRHKRTRP